MRWKQISTNEWTHGSAREIQQHDSDLTIDALVAEYHNSALQQLAVSTIHQALDKDNIFWMDIETNVPDESIPVPSSIHHFISEAVRNLAICGFIVWRVTARGIEIADPSDVSIKWKRNRWVPYAVSDAMRMSKGWHVSFSDCPIRRFDQLTDEGNVTANQLRSSCVKSYAETQRLHQIEAHWLSRDMHNSRPSTFTTVSDHLGSVGSSKRTWFRSTTSNAIDTAARALDVDQDFNELVQHRSATIAALDDAMAMDRQRIATRQQFGADDADEDRIHAEHVITDGRQASETKTLVSLADSGYYYNRCRHNVLMLMGVPPQAIGESVNSERTAANHKQYSTALQLFDTTVKKFRRAISEAISHQNAQGTHKLGFHKCLSRAELNHVVPVLKTAEAVKMYACAFDLPREYFDSEKIEAMAGIQEKKAPGERTITNHLKAGGD